MTIHAHPSALLVKNGAKTFLNCLRDAEPRSDTDSWQSLDARGPDADDAIFARRILIASIPFTTRFRMTC